MRTIFIILATIVATIGTLIFRLTTGRGLIDGRLGKKNLPKWRKKIAEITNKGWREIFISGIVLSILSAALFITYQSLKPKNLELDFEGEVSPNRNLVLRAQNNTGYDIEESVILLKGFQYNKLGKTFPIDPSISGEYKFINSGRSVIFTITDLDKERGIIGFVRLSCYRCKTTEFFIHYDITNLENSFSMKVNKNESLNNINIENRDAFFKEYCPTGRRKPFVIIK